MKRTLLILLLCVPFCGLAFSQEAKQIDEFGNIGCEGYLQRIDSAVLALRENPTANVYFLVYEGGEERVNHRKNKVELVPPTFGLAKAKIRSMKKYLSTVRRFPAEKFAFVEAGFRERFIVEIWLVPKGAEPPKATSTLRKMKYRKGSPRGFCLGCCEG